MPDTNTSDKRFTGPIAKPGPRVLLLGLVIAVAFLAHAAFSAGHAPASGPVWRPFGLTGVTVHDLALDRQGKPAFAATQTGIYRYRPGRGWPRVLKTLGVWSLALLPDDRTVVAGENDGHVDLSTDGGVSWQRRFLTPQGVYAVTAAPHHPRHLLAGAGGGIYISLDGGLHWKQSIHLRNTAIAAFAWSPGTDDVVFAGAISGGSGGSEDVYESRDGGRTWQTYGHGLRSGGGIMSLSVLTAPQLRLVAGTMGNATSEISLERTAWHKTAGGMPPRNDHVSAIATDPARPGTVFAATLAYGVFESHDFGSRWKSISAGLPVQANAKIVLSIVYAPSRHTLYGGTVNGVYVLHHVQ